MDARARAAPAGAAARVPLRAVPARPLRAADQGPLDWLVPFIPPFLRVNRDTREQIWAGIAEATSPAAMQRAVERGAVMLRVHGTSIAKWTALAAVWIAGLVWVQANVHELATAYVILSALVALGAHAFSGETTAATDVDGEKLSAYSVFNKGARRMMGSLSAEQFENEIRHRGPGHDDDDDGDIAARQARNGHPMDIYEDDEEEDPGLLEAIRQSLEEKKREERRLRRTQRRR